jgi:hypothetical protein
MKVEICLALIILAIIPASAQSAATRSCREKDSAGLTLAEDYSSRVNGVLRDVHATLQEISERAAAGRLARQQADTLKLAATRDAIARLETISAVYDARLRANSKDIPDSRSVSVDSLMREAGARTVVDSKSAVGIEKVRQEAGQ